MFRLRSYSSPGKNDDLRACTTLLRQLGFKVLGTTKKGFDLHLVKPDKKQIMLHLLSQTPTDEKLWDHFPNGVPACLAFNSRMTGTITSDTVRKCLNKGIALCSFCRDKITFLETQTQAITTTEIRRVLTVIRKFEAQRLSQRLRRCAPGKRDWKEYEDICEDIFRFLFTSSLGEPQVQPTTIAGIKRRDLIFPNRSKQGFWSTTIRGRYKGEYVLVECKNLTGEISAVELQQGLNYLIADGIGLFGIILSRTPLNSGAHVLRNSEWLRLHKMLIVLQDQHLLRMLAMYAQGQEAFRVIEDAIDRFRTSVA